MEHEIFMELLICGVICLSVYLFLINRKYLKLKKEINTSIKAHNNGRIPKSTEEENEQKIQYVNPIFYIVYGENYNSLSESDMPVIADYVINFDDLKNNNKINYFKSENKVYVEFKTIDITKLKQIDV